VLIAFDIDRIDEPACCIEKRERPDAIIRDR